MKFSINNFVKVKLTQHGLQVHKNHIDNIVKQLPNSLKYRYDYYALDTNEDGYTEFQLWELMQIFGNHMGNGFENCFETEIIISEKETPLCIMEGD